MRLIGRLSVWTLRLSIGCVLLNAAMPLVAVALSHARGVPLTHLCHLYGVVLPGQTSDLHDEADGANGHAHAEPGGGSESHHGDGGESTDRGECALRGLVNQAFETGPDLRAMREAPANDGAAVPVELPHHGSPDAVARWVGALAHAPPQLS